MLRKVGQTAGPIGLKFFVDTHGWPAGVISAKIFFFIIEEKIFFPTGNAPPFS